MEQLKDFFKNVRFFDLVVSELDNQDINSPDYLSSLMWSSYFAYILSNNDLSKKMLGILNQCEFDGNYDKWNWIEGGLALLSKIYKEENRVDEAIILIDKIIRTIDYGDDKFKNNLKRKTFLRRSNGQLLDKEKIEQARQSKNLELELLYSLNYLKELIFIKELEWSEKFSVDELSISINETLIRIRNIINS